MNLVFKIISDLMIYGFKYVALSGQECESGGRRTAIRGS